MAVQGVNMMNASYPKYLENKKQRGMLLGMTGGATALSVSALHYLNHPVAVKNPKLMIGAAIVSSVLALIGIGGAANAQKELNQFNKMNNLDVKV